MNISRERATLEPMNSGTSTSESEYILDDELTKTLLHISSEQTIIRKETEQALFQTRELAKEMAEQVKNSEGERTKSVQDLRIIISAIEKDLAETKRQRELRGTEYMQANRDTATALRNILQQIENIRIPEMKPKEIMIKVGILSLTSIMGGLIIFLVFLLLSLSK